MMDHSRVEGAISLCVDRVRWIGLEVEMGGFRDQGVETGRFRYM